MVLLGLIAPARAVNYTWTGAASTDWGNAANWSPAGVPGDADTVVVGDNKVVATSSNRSVRSLALSAGSTLLGTGSVTVNSNLAVTDATLDGTGSVTVPAGGSARFNSSGGGTRIKRKFINSGTAVLSGGSLIFAADVTNSAGAVFEVQSDSPLLFSSSSAPVFYNQGSFVKSAGTGSTRVDLAFNNSGIISVRSGVLDVGARFTQAAGSVSMDGGDLATSGTMMINGGSIEGSGTIAGNVYCNGRMQPGHSPGTITISGNYTQTSNGTLDMEIGGLNAGTQYDQLVIYGSASLAGTLNIIQWAGYVPAPGASFQLLKYYDVAGNFSPINKYWPGSQCYFTITITPTYYVATSYTDGTAPAVTVTTPVNDAGYATITTATGTVSDGGSGLVGPVTVMLYRYAVSKTAAGYWAGGSTWTSTYSANNERPATGTSNWSLTLPTLATGKFLLRATARDGVGNSTKTPDVVFWKDSTAPATVTFTSPLSGSYVTNLNSVSGTAVDYTGGSGIARVELTLQRSSDKMYWTGSTWSASLTPLSTVLNATTWTRSTNMPAGAALASGAYALVATACDRSNLKKSVSATCTFDGIAPTVAMTAPVANRVYTSLSSITGTAADTGGSTLGSVKVVLYRYGNATATPGYWAGKSIWTTALTATNEQLASGTSSWSRSLTTLLYGCYQVRAVARDKAGNVTYTPDVLFWFSKGASTVIFSSGTASAASGSISLKFTAPLDSYIARDAGRYVVTVNRETVAVQSITYSATTNTVTLTLPAGALAPGASSTVSWTNLFDSLGKNLSGQSSTLVAQ